MNRVTCSNMDGYHHNFTIGSWESLISSWSKVAVQISNMMFAIGGKNCRYSMVSADKCITDIEKIHKSFLWWQEGIITSNLFLQQQGYYPQQVLQKENTFMYQIYQHSFQQQVSSQTSSLSPMPAQNIHLNV